FAAVAVLEEDGVEAGVAENAERRVGMSNAAEEERFAADQELAAVVLDDLGTGWARRAGGLAGDVRGRPRRRLRPKLGHRTNFQIIDPQLGRPGTGIDVQD